MSGQVPEIANKLSALREQRGLSASMLAETVGVSRQTIYAIEKGSFVPNTSVALHLARALSVSVDELFQLSAEASSSAPTESVTLLSSSNDLQPGQPVRLCDVDGRLVAAPAAASSWFLPPSDAVMAATGARRNKAKVNLYESGTTFHNRLLIAGCDPAMSLVARHAQPAGLDLVLLQQNSSQALALLKRGSIHVAGTHLHDDSTGQSNLSAIHRLFPTNSVAVVSFAVWEEGLVVSQGNPKHIKGVEDLGRKRITFLNRELGAGSRLLLDSQLKRSNIDAKLVSGYNRTAPGHLAAAWEVKAGTADCCLATRSAAQVFGLHFIPLQSSRYDLVMRKQHLTLTAMQTLLDTISRASFRKQLQATGGYGTDVTGDRVL